ncbi:Metal-sulfur cluster biosynthetic enzyme [Halogranum amylolyticum]|uniref:Metal-sulfur cluster biosynthetic enzyme n=1 Tax=Halogranum amylolyticum TaxID=660520 RepID=A0A1H8PGH1_9EURY|nr:iron-sulfur cluster assembly protein [Halogranum amylolyticum]SEO40643.1 Metal-sulfur cluster biosynthetic enzyme [Halogranum amylolyticum]
MDGPVTSVTQEAVQSRLDRVTDPELDRSIVALDYVESIAIDLPAVHVTFSLPTAWCSPAFAWMMATDARREVETLAGVDRAVVELRDHMHDAEINRGVNEGLSFEASFPDADGEVDDVRRELDEKALLSRQYDAVSTLLDAGLSPEQVTRLTPARLGVDPAADDPRTAADDADDVPDTATVFVREGTVGVTVPLDPVRSYLAKARPLGVVTDPEDPLFRTPDGDPLTTENFERVHHRTRLTATNMDGQGGICAYLHEARHGRDGDAEPVEAESPS